MKLILRRPDRGYLDSSLWVPKALANVDAAKAALTFQVSDDRKIRFAALYKETEHHLVVPREFWDPRDLHYPVVDVRPTSFERVDVRSKITLDFKDRSKTTQRDAVDALLRSRGGVLQLACGKGKTVVSLEVIARRGYPALIAVDNTQLLEQWLEAIDAFLEVPGGVGLIQGPVFDWRRAVVLSTFQTLAARAADMPAEVRRWFGTFVADEAHHLGAPTFSLCADLTYGFRLGLTATPERVDGMHVVHALHLGPVVYKDLVQELRPEIYFHWTGLQVDPQDPRLSAKVCDVNGELHLSMLYTYFGQWQERLELILAEIRKAEEEGRNILVLSYSIDELVNLLALYNGESIYQDPPSAGPPPAMLQPRAHLRMTNRLGELRRRLAMKTLAPNARRSLSLEKVEVERVLAEHDRGLAFLAEREKRKRAFMRELLRHPTAAGLMIGALKPAERQEMLRQRQTVFAIMKYGREGLDKPALDTVFVCEPLSQRGGLGQLLGRILRAKSGKKVPKAVFFEDDIGPIIGMCRVLRKHLRYWPPDEGGPYDYHLIGGHPQQKGMMPKWRT